MNPRIENLRGYILRKEHHVLRRFSILGFIV